MKKHLIIFIIFLLSICCFLTSCTIPIITNNITDVYYQTWMNSIIDTALIKQIAIPGSHDSGTIGMNSMYCTQNTTINQQLYTGVRYFDIRVRKEKNDVLKIFHAGSSGVEFIPILYDIKNFIIKYPSEFLILDFQHFDKDSELKVLENIYKSGLNKFAVTNNTELSDLDFIDSLKLKDVRGKIIIFWGRDKGSEDKIVFRRNNDRCTLENCPLDSYYYSNQNKKSSTKYINEGLPFYFSQYKTKNKGLWVLQGQLTKPGANLYKLENKHNDNMNNFIINIKNNAEYLLNVNIIIRDFIGNDLNKVNNIINLNNDKMLLK